MKKLFLYLAMALFLIPNFSLAAVVRSDGDVIQSEAINGNLYLTGSSPVIAGTVEGDAEVAGGNVTISGYVYGDVLALAGTVIITGHVGGDVRVVAGRILVNGPVDGDVMAFGGTIEFGKNAVVGGDTVVNGSVTIDPAAKIMGQQKFSSEPTGAASQNADTIMGKFASGAFWFAMLLNLMGFMVIGILMFGVFPKFTQATTNEIVSKGHFWKSLGLGLLILVLFPVVAFFSIISGVGALLGFILILMYIALLLISMVFAGILLGGLLLHGIKKTKKFQLNWQAVIGGIVLLQFLQFIPFIGIATYFVLILLALGALTRIKWLAMGKF